MALRIRLQRGGAAHAPVYRMVVTEALARRDGRCVEYLGTYAPKARGKDVELRLELERIDYWMSVGAKPSDTANTLIKKARKAPKEEVPVPAAVAAPAAVTETPAPDPDPAPEAPAEPTTPPAE